MKAFVMGAGGAFFLAVLAAIVLQGYVNKPADKAFATPSVRVH